MSTRYPGGFINRSAPVIVGPTNGEGGSAPGVWTLEQASYYTKQGTWPQRIKNRPLFVWGLNQFGQLGLNDVDNRSSPTQVGNLTTWSSISAGYSSSYGISTSGTLWSWGLDNWGELGLGATYDERSSPTQVGALTNWSTITGSFRSAFAIKTDGTLWSWGNNIVGELGTGNVIYRSSPVQVGSQTNWSFVVSRYRTVFALKTDGSLWSWGEASYGATGQNGSSTAHKSSPTQIGALTTWLSVGSGTYNAAATKTDGTLWTWGYNLQGQLGQGNVTNRSSPTQVGALTTWINVSCGNYHVMAVKSDGTLWSWGNGYSGQLAQNNSIYRSSPVQVGALTTWSKAFCGVSTTFMLSQNGTLWAAGAGSVGQLGLNDVNIPRSSPVQIGSGTNWNFVSSNGSFSVANQLI